MNEKQMKKIFNKKYKSPFIKNLPNILMRMSLNYPMQIKGLLNQKYKHIRLINYILNQAAMHHNTLSLDEKSVEKYIMKYFKNNKKVGVNDGNK